MNFDKMLLKVKVLDFTASAVEKFLLETDGVQFYAFGFDCNIEYAEIGLCFNTEESFSETLNKYQVNYPENYNKASKIYDLRYNMGDWAEQGFEMLYFAENDELTFI